MRKLNCFTLMVFFIISGVSLGVGSSFVDKKIIEAIENQNSEEVEALLKDGFIDLETSQKRVVNPNAVLPGGKKFSLLHKASSLNSVEIVKLLLHYGAEINSQNKSKATPLHRALLSKKEKSNEIAMYLLQKGADIYAKAGRDKNLPIHLAAAAGYADVVDVILAKDPSLVDVTNRTKRDPYKETALFIASRENHNKVIRVLIAGGADINYKTPNGKKALNPQGFSSSERREVEAQMLERERVRTESHEKLREAIESHELSSAIYSLGDGARLNGLSQREGKEEEKLYDNDQTTLHLAARSKNIQFVNFAINPIDFDEAEKFQEFLSSSFKPLNNKEINKVDKNGKTALKLAIEVGSKAIADMLIKRIPEISIPEGNPKSTTGLHLALEKKRFDAIEYFLWVLDDEDLDVKDGLGRTPLRLAMILSMREKNKEKKEQLLCIADNLITKVSEIKEKNETSQTEFQLAVEKNRADVVFYFLHFARRKENIFKGVLAKEIGLLDTRGYNSIHVAAEKGYDEVLAILLEYSPEYTDEMLNNKTLLPYSFAQKFLTIKTAKKIKNKAVRDYRNYAISDISKITVPHDTALHLASRYDNLKCVELLLKAKANTYIYNKEGFTPWGEYKKQKGKDLNPTQQKIRMHLKNTRRFQ